MSSLPNLRLDGKNALVCGASRGIGAATATALAAAGARVTALARNADQLAAVVRQLPALADSRHQFLAVDVTDTDALLKALTERLSNNATIDILVNNSGGPPAGPAREAAVAAFEAAFRQHLVANHVLMRALLPGMRSKGGGRIINVVSTSVKEPIAGLGVSNTIRGAVANWSKSLARELGPHNITVNNVLPGYTNTERLREVLKGRTLPSGRSLAQVETDARAEVPMGRFGHPEEIAAAVLFLASNMGSYVNGANLVVDGGLTSSL